MAPQTGRTGRRRARGSIQRDDIVEAAFRTLSQSGFAGLTMQAVAAEVGAPVMSLYRYVSSKDELLSMLADRVADVLYTEAPPEGLHWRDLLHQQSCRIYEELVAHPGYAELIFFRGRLSASANSGQRVRAYVNDALRALTEAGMTMEQASHAFYGLSTIVVGFALELEGQGGEQAPLLPKMQQVAAGGDPATFPFLEHGRQFAPDMGTFAHFEFVLNCFLDGLARVPGGATGDSALREGASARG